MNERIEKLVERREKLTKIFSEKLSSYGFNGNLSTEGCAYSFYEEGVFLYMYFNGINTLFLMADEEVLKSKTNSEPYRQILNSQTFDGEGLPTVVVFSKKERDIIVDLINKTIGTDKYLFGLKNLVIKVA